MIGLQGRHEGAELRVGRGHRFDPRPLEVRRRSTIAAAQRPLPPLDPNALDPGSQEQVLIKFPHFSAFRLFCFFWLGGGVWGEETWQKGETRHLTDGC